MGNDEHKTISFPLWTELTALLPFMEGEEFREILDVLDVTTSEWVTASDSYVAEVLADDAGARADEFALACAKAYDAGRDGARARLDFIRQQFGRDDSRESFEAVDETQLLAVARPGAALPFGSTPSSGFIAQPTAHAHDDADAGFTAALPALRESADDTLPFGKPLESTRKDR